METRTYAEIAGIIILMVSLGVNVIPNDQGYIPYSCDVDTIPDYMCYKLSRVNDDGIQRNCYYDRDNSRKYKVCSTGWDKIINTEEYDAGFTVKECPFILAYTDEGRYLCNGVGNDAQCLNEYLEPSAFEDIGW